MAFDVDLNLPPDEGDGEGLLNWPPEEGDGEVLPDLNEEATGHEEHEVATGVHGWGSEEAPPFNLNFLAPEDQEHMQPYVDIGLDTVIPDLNEDAVEDHIANQQNRRKETTAQERQAIYEALLEKSTLGKLKRNSTRIVANQFHVSMRTVQRVWKQAKKCRAQGQPIDVSPKKRKNCGRKRFEVDLSRVANLAYDKRCTIKKLANELKVSKSLVHKWFKEGLLRRHSNVLKPLLKEANKKERLRWCLSMLDPTTLPHDPKFIEMDNIIHIDEKWFNATKKNKKFYLLPREADPYRTVRNKNSIGKVMVLAAVALPRHDALGNETFSGKIGVWPFVRKEPAQRRSRNRERGTLVTKSITVDRDIMRSYLIAKVLPAIVEKWPREDRNRTIWIQQDNARTHVPINDEQFAIAAAQTGLDIRLINQPPNSPDMNCLDLGFFNSLQSLTDEIDCTTMDDIIANVYKKFDEYDSTLLKRVFLTLQSCLIEVMKLRGGNRYQIPHMNKARLEALGILPRRLNCDAQLYHDVIQFMAANGEN